MRLPATALALQGATGQHIEYLTYDEDASHNEDEDRPPDL
jgi:hypothetical protein